MTTDKKACSTPEKILNDFIESRKKRIKTGDKILESLLKQEDPSCALKILEQLKDFFGDELHINNLIEESIQKELKPKPPIEGWVVPERESGYMREFLKSMERVTSKDQLDKKYSEGISRMEELYKNKLDMQQLWSKRLDTQKEKTEKKLKKQGFE